MATTVAGDKQIEIYNVTLSATAGNVTEIMLPGKPSVLVLTARTDDSKLCATSAIADDDAIGASAYVTLTAGSPYTVDVSGIGHGYIFLASATSSAVVEMCWQGL
jgi:hypothetical protein